MTVEYKGFKFRRTSFTAVDFGSNYGVFYNWGTRDDKTIARAKSVITSLARALYDMNIGWDLDSDFHDSHWIDDPDNTGYITSSYYGDTPIKDSTEYMPYLLLKNSISGNKLFLSYLCNSCQYGIDIPNSQMCTQGSIENPSYTGLLVSMIPGESDQTFGDPLNGSLIPYTATPLYGSCEAGDKTGIQISYARANTSGTVYCWDILATPYCIAMMINSSTDGTTPTFKLCFAVGRIFGSLAHEENAVNARYGVLCFTQHAQGKDREGGVIKENDIDYGDAKEKTVGTSTFRIAPNINGATKDTGGCIAKANGTYIGYTLTANIRFSPDSVLHLCRYVKDDDSNLRWIPYIVGVVSDDLQNDGIIQGDGVKGILDTDLFRCGRIEGGHSLCGGKFYSLYKNLIIGWNPSNVVPQ